VRRGRFAYTDYAEDALGWHHRRCCLPECLRQHDRNVLARWRADDSIDVGEVIRLQRVQEQEAAQRATGIDEEQLSS
jgi:hypothetical protein